MRRSDYLSQDSEPVVEEVRDNNPRNNNGQTISGGIVDNNFFPSRENVEANRFQDVLNDLARARAANERMQSRIERENIIIERERNQRATSYMNLVSSWED